MHVMVRRLLAEVTGAKVDEEVSCGLRLVVKQTAAVVNQVLLACLGSQRAQIPEGVFILLGIFNLDAQVVLVATVLPRQVGGVLKEARLATNTDRGVEVERQLIRAGIPLRLVFDESIETGTV